MSESLGLILQVVLLLISLFALTWPSNKLFGALFGAKFLLLKEEKISDENTNEQKVRDAEDSLGKIIGSLERILVFISLIKSQYILVGIILTVKSFARFNELRKTKNHFAEKYIIGTLYSLLVSISVYQIYTIISLLIENGLES